MRSLGALVAGVRAWDATSSFDGMTVGVSGLRSGLAGADAICLLGVGAVGVARMGCGGVLGRKSLTLGTGPIDDSVSVAQSNRCGSCGAGLMATLAVGDGAGCMVLSSCSRIP
jgi:hypothetical protein